LADELVTHLNVPLEAKQRLLEEPRLEARYGEREGGREGGREGN